MGEQSQAQRALLLDLCEKVELTMAELYRELAQQQRKRADLYRLWMKTAGEEDNHAMQFGRAASMGEAIGDVLLSEQQIGQMLAKARALYASVRTRPPTPLAALEQAMVIEQDLSECHMAFAATFAEHQVRTLFEAMLAADRAHVEALARQIELEQSAKG
jgi:hypothetical protein